MNFSATDKTFISFHKTKRNSYSNNNHRKAALHKHIYTEACKRKIAILQNK